MQNSDFLKQLDLYPNKTQWVKIIVLDWNERPIQDITGKITSGSINVDGSSGLRQTANLTMVVDTNDAQIMNVNNIVSINKKVRLQIGQSCDLTNNDIYWFNRGVFVVQSASISHSTSGITISLTLKDKMCLLNGDCGGTLPAQVVFSEIESLDNNIITISHPTIYQIIQEAVNHWGGEQLGKIIINDVPLRIRQTLKWLGDDPIYIKGDGTNKYYTQITTTPHAGENWNKYVYGDNIGFEYADFIYSGELIGEAGTTVFDILTKIRDYLGNYEFFYDNDGNFVFQEIKNYLNTSESTSIIEQLNAGTAPYYVDRKGSKAVYTFDNANIVTSFANTPQYNMIKNDFIVWGIRESNGIKHSVRYHLAIDKKPQLSSWKTFVYTDSEDNLVKAKGLVELDQLPEVGEVAVFYLVNGKVYQWINKDVKYKEVQGNYTETAKSSKDWRTELYLQGTCTDQHATNSNDYYAELKAEWPKNFDFENMDFYPETISQPYNLDYWLDIIDEDSAISEFSISNIGKRTKVISSDEVNCVFAPVIPNLILIEKDCENINELREEAHINNYSFLQVDSEIYSNLAIGKDWNSAFDYIRDLLYQYTNYNESITIQCLPIFHLDANTMIHVTDRDSNINGYYMIKSYSLPLDISGTMSISCTKVQNKI